MYMDFMYANAYIICVRYVVASVDPPLSYYRSTCTPMHPHPPFSTPAMPDGRWPSVCTYICSSALIYRICIAVNQPRATTDPPDTFFLVFLIRVTPEGNQLAKPFLRIVHRGHEAGVRGLGSLFSFHRCLRVDGELTKNDRFSVGTARSQNMGP